MAIGACPIYGTHRMISQGFANADNYQNKARIFSGGWYKCACGERVVASGYPHFGGAIGSYVTEGGIYKLYASYSNVTSFWVYPNLVYYSSSSTIPGYQFLSQ
ncbi:hypothetical protein [Tumebacillus avium]|uniref:hypothetical protein n=1 Tax=Tumebacillus avium TaxID=1903704 RepID=UPI0012FD99AD|nr:hypothetical protein [Tumebacillus avium]